VNSQTTGRWKRAFTFSSNELSTLSSLLAAFIFGALAFKWPAHPAVMFAIGSVAGIAFIYLAFDRSRIRRPLLGLSLLVATILCFALYIHFKF
jgi:hypothetical protein